MFYFVLSYPALFRLTLFCPVLLSCGCLAIYPSCFNKDDVFLALPCSVLRLSSRCLMIICPSEGRPLLEVMMEETIQTYVLSRLTLTLTLTLNLDPKPLRSFCDCFVVVFCRSEKGKEKWKKTHAMAHEVFYLVRPFTTITLLQYTQYYYNVIVVALVLSCGCLVMVVSSCLVSLVSCVLRLASFLTLPFLFLLILVFVFV